LRTSTDDRRTGANVNTGFSEARPARPSTSESVIVITAPRPINGEGHLRRAGSPLGRSGRLSMQNDATMRELTDAELNAVSGGLGYRCETNTGGGWSRTGCEYRSEDLAADIATTVRWAT
jgi:hypothetical protein